jgi:hypothetical protein
VALICRSVGWSIGFMKEAYNGRGSEGKQKVKEGENLKKGIITV